jgi:hypothetical protein
MEDEMKKTLFVLLIIGLVLFLAACNTNDGPGGGPGGEGGNEDAEDVTWDASYGAKVENSEKYPGFEIPLEDRELVDISKYASVTVKATLYTDEAGTVKATTPTGDNKNLAQFKLLKATGDWDVASNICGPTKYEMNVDGDTIWNVPPTASGVPARLLLQANWENFTADGTKVKFIKVGEITFTARISDASVILDLVYNKDNGNFYAVSGNKITFNNASNDAGAALLIFPDSFPKGDALKNKEISIKFSIPTHEENPSTANAIDVEHQLRIQAAQNTPEKNKVNTKDAYQLYPTLDSPGETGWSADSRSGTLKLSPSDVNKLLDGATDEGFTLDAIRIVNDGTTWTGGNPSATHVRCKSYVLEILSVEVK